MAVSNASKKKRESVDNLQLAVAPVDYFEKERLEANPSKDERAKVFDSDKAALKECLQKIREFWDAQEVHFLRKRGCRRSPQRLQPIYCRCIPTLGPSFSRPQHSQLARVKRLLKRPPTLPQTPSPNQIPAAAQAAQAAVAAAHAQNGGSKGSA